MAIETADISFKLSGGAANADGNLSIGGAKSSVVMGETLNDLFDQVSGDESAAGDIEYRLVYIENNHGTLIAQNPKVWIESQTTSPDTSIAIGIGAAGLNGVESAIGDEDSAPAGVSFSTPANKAAGLTIPNMPAGQHIPLWIRRTVNAGASAINNDASQIDFACDSAE